MKQDHRFEVKIPIPHNRLAAVQTWLFAHKLGFKTHHEDRWVNSLYLDLPNLASYEENLSGISQRKKVRIRWYNSLTKPKKTKLEFKHRRGGKGHKVIFNTQFNLEKNNYYWSRTLKESYLSLPDKGKATWCNEISPVLLCRYLRSYYLSSCKKIRVTMDENMHVYDQRYKSKANFSRPTSLGSYTLLEVKCDGQDEAQLSNLLGSCPLRPSKHSKYVNGLRNLTWV